MRSADSTDRSPELQTLVSARVMKPVRWNEEKGWILLISQRAASTEGLRPVTIRQLVNATRDHSDAPFHIDDIEVRDVVVVAQVLRIRRFDTITMFDLEDGTTGGSIIAKRWRNGRDDSELPTTLDEQLYARIVGRLARGKEAKNALEVKTLRVITDPHELLFHILEVAFVHLCFERGPPPVSVRETIEPRGATGVHYEPLAGLPATAPNTPAIPRTRAANVRPTPNPDRSDASASRTSVTPRPETPPPRPPPDSPSPPTSPSPAPTRRVQAPAIPSPSGPTPTRTLQCWSVPSSCRYSTYKTHRGQRKACTSERSSAESATTM
ncbi:hypothetical protein C8Q77DRAFT_537662 [Trametes polyzona]|nr:hypothetical protein C8Q77DRAFT_537662 [Trametes polyzona]